MQVSQELKVTPSRILLHQKGNQLPDHEMILERVKKNNQHFFCTVHKDSTKFGKQFNFGSNIRLSKDEQ